MLVADLLRTLQSIDLHAVFPPLGTAYSKYSNSNHAAASWEIPAIREIILQQKKQLDDIDTVIDRAQAMVDQLDRKREEILSSLNTNKGLVSCIRRLPLETLQEIFIRCLPRTKHVIPNTQKAPLLLTRICRSWRELALNTPRLWCSLHLEKLGQLESLFICHDWLKNAKGCPLTLNVNICPPSRNSGWREAILGFLKLHSNQLKDFTIHFDRANGLDLLLKDTPRLEQLCLIGDFATMRRKPASIVQMQPCLRTLIIHSSIFKVSALARFKPAWKNLTRLSVVIRLEDGLYPDEAMFWALLQTCPNLVHFVFSPLRLRKHSNPISLTHPMLQFLDISLGRFDSGPLLNSLSLPSLRHLRFGEVSNRLPNPTFFEEVSSSSRLASDTTQHRTFSVTFAEEYLPMHDLLMIFNPGRAFFTCFTVDMYIIDEDVEWIEEMLCPILQLCPNLEHLTVAAYIALIADHEASPLIIHQGLRSLSLRIHPTAFLGLLEHLTLPNLSHIDITLTETSPWAEMHTQFKKFLSRSCCSLETLEIREAQMSIEEREEFATLIPSLHSLGLYLEEDRTADWNNYSWTR